MPVRSPTRSASSASRSLRIRDSARLSAPRSPRSASTACGRSHAAATRSTRTTCAGSSQTPRPMLAPSWSATAVRARSSSSARSRVATTFRITRRRWRSPTPARAACSESPTRFTSSTRASTATRLPRSRSSSSTAADCVRCHGRGRRSARFALGLAGARHAERDRPRRRRAGDDDRLPWPARRDDRGTGDRRGGRFDDLRGSRLGVPATAPPGRSCSSGASHHEHRPGQAHRCGQLPAQRLPRDGRRDDEDVVLVDLQRGARLLVRVFDVTVARSPAASSVRRISARPLHRRLVHPGARQRDIRGGRRGPP